MKTIKQSIQIDTFFEVEEKNFAGRVISVNREVRVDNELVYQCKMSPKIYQISEDPIRKLEEYILGIKKSTDNALSNRKRKKPATQKKLARVKKIMVQALVEILRDSKPIVSEH